MILSASAHMKGMRRGKYEVQIDLKPALEEKQLDARLQRDFLQNANRVFANSLDALLPRKLIPVIVRLSGIAAGLKVNQVTREMRQGLVSLLKGLRLTVTAFAPLRRQWSLQAVSAQRRSTPKQWSQSCCQGSILQANSSMWMAIRAASTCKLPSPPGIWPGSPFREGPKAGVRLT